MSVEETLGQFKETEGSEPFQLQGSKMLKVRVADETIQAKLGSMVAYQGDVSFEHAGSGGLGRMLKKAVSGEGTKRLTPTKSRSLTLPLSGCGAPMTK